MRRAERLFHIIQILRRGGRPVTAAAIAAELEVTPRTVYRDIADLKARRVPIDGEAGVGYILRPGFDLPPLMFEEDELDALLLGVRVVQSWADPALARAAGDVLAKIAAVLPEALQPRIQSLRLVAPPTERRPEPSVDVVALRHAMRRQRKVRITYLDLRDQRSERTLWPMNMAFFPPVWLTLAWCELRVDFRTFRLDRIETLTVLDETYPQEPGKRLVDYLRREGYLA